MPDIKVRATVRDDAGERYVTETIENVDDEQVAVAQFRRRHPRMIELHSAQRVAAPRGKR